MIRISSNVHRTPVLLTLVLALSACAADETERVETAELDTAAMPAPAAISFTDVAFQTPESVLHDEAGDMYLVSNINGGPTDKDDNGFITRLSPDGQRVELRWIDGASAAVTLHAPKGMAIRGDSLFVSDIDTVRIFNRNTGEPLGGWGVPNADFLNDLAVGPDGTLYVTDSGVNAASQGAGTTATDAVYRFGPNGETETVASGGDLARPNGIVAGPQDVVVVTFGANRVVRLDPTGTPTELATLPAGQLDGVVRLGDGTLLVSSWEGQAVYRVPPGGARIDTVLQNVESPADIGYDARRNRLLIPLFMPNRVEVREVR